MPHLVHLTARTRFLLTLAALAAALLLAATGCSSDATGSGAASVQSAAVYDNPSSSTADSSASSSSGSGSHGYTGTLSGTAQMQLSTDGQAWVSLAPPAAVSLALQSTANGTTLASSASIPAGTYAYVRLVFSPGAQASVSGTIGGSSYSSSVVALGSGQLVIEKHVAPVIVNAGSSVHVAWDLNSELWLTPAAMTAHAVAQAAIEAAAFAEIR